MREQVSPYEIAKQNAKKIHQEYPAIFSKSVGLDKLKYLLKILHVSIDSTTNKLIEGRLEIGDEIRVIVNENLSRNRRIQTLAHELGHLLLRKLYPYLEEKWTLNNKELYANIFANELCIPYFEREAVIEELANTPSIKRALVLSSRYGINLSNFFSTMLFEYRTKEQTVVSDSNIWLLTKFQTNKFTKVEPKLRVVNAFYDPHKFYVAVNQGVDRVIEDLFWIKDLPLAMEMTKETDINIQMRRKKSKPEYQKVMLKSKCSALRIHDNEQNGSSAILLLLRF